MVDTHPELATDGEPGMATTDQVRASEQAAERPIQEREPSNSSLLSEQEVGELRIRWNEIQTGFVDEPRRAVEDADALVAAAMQRLAEIFASERSQLENQWGRGDDVSTEDLCLALQRYRSFFGRLLSI